MVREIITIFCICDDYLKSIGEKDHHQAQMTTSEILTTAIVASKYFGGNYTKSRVFMKEHCYVRKMLSKSRFTRKLNSIDGRIFRGIFAVMAEIFKKSNSTQNYAIDSFPVPVCSNIRIKKCKIYQNGEYRGYSAVKNNYFYGVRVHMLTTKNGHPIEFTIEPGSRSDIKVAKEFKFEIQKKSTVHADKGYTDYAFEDYLDLQKNINFAAIRKKNSRRKSRGVCKKTRKIIETAFSLITMNFPKKIHAVTAQGFELKVVMFIFAYAMGFLVAT